MTTLPSAPANNAARRAARDALPLTGKDPLEDQFYLVLGAISAHSPRASHTRIADFIMASVPSEVPLQAQITRAICFLTSWGYVKFEGTELSPCGQVTLKLWSITPEGKKVLQAKERRIFAFYQFALRPK